MPSGSLAIPNSNQLEVISNLRRELDAIALMRDLVDAQFTNIPDSVTGSFNTLKDVYFAELSNLACQSALGAFSYEGSADQVGLDDLPDLFVAIQWWNEVVDGD